MWDQTVTWQGRQFLFDPNMYRVDQDGLNFAIHPRWEPVTLGGDSITFTLDTVRKQLNNFTVLEYPGTYGPSQLTIDHFAYSILSTRHLSASWFGKQDTLSKLGAVFYCACPNCETDNIGGGISGGVIFDSISYIQIDAGLPIVQAVIPSDRTAPPAMMADYAVERSVVRSRFRLFDSRRELIIRDALGRFVTSKPILPYETEAEFNAFSWPAGVYFLTLNGACVKLLIP